jgi:hypothetical protein
MRPLKHLARISPFFFLPILYLVRKKQTGKSIVFLFLTFTLTGCFQYFYKTNTRNTIDTFAIQQLQAANKYFIVHFRDSAIALNNIMVSNEKIEGSMVQLLPEHKKYLNPDKTTVTTQTTRFSPKKTHYRVKAADRNNTLMEVHLYVDEDIRKDQVQLSLPVSSFKRIDVYALDREATTANHILSIVGGTLLIGSAVALIAFAIACNCPQVYVNNNGDCQFISGVYSGAVYSSLERTDYLPLLSLNSPEKTYKLQIRNVKDEEQFMNRIQLLQVSHSTGSEVLIDRHGNIFTYNHPIAPTAAISDKKTDIKKQIGITDDDQYSFDSEKSKNGLSSTVLTFKKPEKAKKAKLIVHAGNSNWSGYLYHSFAELFGNGYEKWKVEKDKSDPKEMEKWQTDQGLPLMVYIERNGKWEFADYFAHTGNTASRDMIMELDLTNTKSSEIKIKLETVYQFWNLDFAGIDFSENNYINSTILNPAKALKADDSDQTRYLNEVDKNYTYLKPEEEMSLEYQPVSSDPNSINSYFLVSTGYYHNLKKYEGPPKVATLLKFKNRNAFDDYSREKFSELQKNLDSYTIQKK